MTIYFVISGRSTNSLTKRLSPTAQRPNIWFDLLQSFWNAPFVNYYIVAAKSTMTCAFRCNSFTNQSIVRLQIAFKLDTWRRTQKQTAINYTKCSVEEMRGQRWKYRWVEASKYSAAVLFMLAHSLGMGFYAHSASEMWQYPKKASTKLAINNWDWMWCCCDVIIGHDKWPTTMQQHSRNLWFLYSNLRTLIARVVLNTFEMFVLGPLKHVNAD